MEIVPMVLETSEYMGGLSRTVERNGNRIDIGGHRFFSKSDGVMNWWLEHLPLETTDSKARLVACHGNKRTVSGNGSQAVGHACMLVRHCKSPIYFLRKFFAYPISLSTETIRNLEITRVFRIGISYLKTLLLPPKDIKNLEQFLISRFGKALFRAYLDCFGNLFLIGRNSMHKYNNQDHSMLTAMTAVDNIVEGRTGKSNIWAVNTEMDYHEQKPVAAAGVPARPLRDAA